MHPKSDVYRIRKVMPVDLRPIIGTAERIITLGTKDPAEAMRKAPAVLEQIDREFIAARAALGPEQRMTQREVVALCGALYRETVEHWEDDPGAAEGWDLFASQLQDAREWDEAMPGGGPSGAATGGRFGLTTGTAWGGRPAA